MSEVTGGKKSPPQPRGVHTVQNGAPSGERVHIPAVKPGTKVTVHKKVVPKATPAELAKARAEVHFLQGEVEKWGIAEMTRLELSGEDVSLLTLLISQQVGNHTAESYRARVRSVLRVNLHEARVIQAIVAASGQSLPLDITPPSQFYTDLKRRLHAATVALFKITPMTLPKSDARPVPGEVQQIRTGDPAWGGPKGDMIPSPELRPLSATTLGRDF